MPPRDARLPQALPSALFDRVDAARHHRQAATPHAEPLEDLKRDACRVQVAQVGDLLHGGALTGRQKRQHAALDDALIADHVRPFHGPHDMDGRRDAVALHERISTAFVEKRVGRQPEVLRRLQPVEVELAVHRLRDVEVVSLDAAHDVVVGVVEATLRPGRICDGGRVHDLRVKPIDVRRGEPDRRHAARKALRRRAHVLRSQIVAGLHASDSACIVLLGRRASRRRRLLRKRLRRRPGRVKVTRDPSDAKAAQLLHGHLEHASNCATAAGTGDLCAFRPPLEV